LKNNAIPTVGLWSRSHFFLLLCHIPIESVVSLS
jgi:hypothetical protein